MMTDFAGLPVAVWLTGRVVGLRAPVRADAGEVNAWYDGMPPITPDDAEQMLVSEERVPWGNNPVLRLMILRLGTDHVIGSVVLRRRQGRTSRLEIVLNGIHDEECAPVEHDVLCVVVPWIVGELGMMTVTMRVAADDRTVIEAAESAGMREVVRFREAIVRPEGRVDMLILERFARAWGRPAGVTIDEHA